jgi:hypothetical protein
MTELTPTLRLRGSLLRALWGNVSRSLRAIQHTVSDGSFRVRFTCECPPSEMVKELQSVAHTACATDFIDGVVVEFETAVVPIGTKVPVWGDWFFLRNNQC